MTTYQDLCNQQQKYNQILLNRKEQLRQAITDFCKALETDLGLTDKRYKHRLNDTTATQPYIKLLNLQSAELESLHIMEQPFTYDNDGQPTALTAVSVTLEQAENTYPKQTVFLKIKFTWCKNEQISLAFMDVPNTPELVVERHNPNKFNDAVELYKSIILQRFTL